MAPERWVVLDDTDPSITYTGPDWGLNSNGLDNLIGFNGPTYQDTLHGTYADATVEFEFNGSAIQVLGSTVSDESAYECFINNARISQLEPAVYGNNHRFCEEDSLSDGHHKLRIDVKITSVHRSFFLDRLHYIPSPDLPVENRVILFRNTDPAIQYDSQWKDLGGIANMTASKNSVARVNFIGTSISWVGMVPTELLQLQPQAPGRLMVGATLFPFPFLPANGNQTLYNQFYFTTPDVGAGPHTLTVTFLGDNQTTPLCLSYLLVKNGTFPAPTSVDNPASTSADNPVSTSVDNRGNSHSGSNIRVIVGGVLGVVVFLIIIASGILFWRRRNIGRDGGFVETEGSAYTPTPFNPHRDNHSNSVAQVHHPDSMTHLHHPNPVVQVHQPQSDPAPDVSTPVTSLVPPPSAQQQSAIRKQQEAFRSISATRYTNNEVEQTGRGGESSSWPRTVTNDTSAVRQHTDSGLRLSRQPVMVIPPEYTPD